MNENTKTEIITLKPSDNISEAIKIFKNKPTTILITDDNKKLVGILTRRDIRYLSIEEIKTKKVSDIFTKSTLITASVGTSRTNLINILKQHKINSIPIVDKNKFIHGIFSYRDYLEQKPLCLTILPFKQPYLNIFSKNIKPAIEKACNIDVFKVDDIFKPEPVIDTIQYLINKADILISDISERNPNVYYEVGYAHALGKKIIFITQNIDGLPFDIRHWKCINYKNTEAGLKKLERELILMVKSIVNDEKKELLDYNL